MAASNSRASCKGGPSTRSARQDSPAPAGPAIRNRIVELRFVRAGELIPNPKAWRRHPEAQRRALQAMLEAIGHADACIARQGPEGLVLLDGHLRRDRDGDAVLPVLVLDVSEAEGEAVLATLDPLAAMALPDADALEALLADVVITQDDLLEFLRSTVPEVAPTGQADLERIPAKPRRSRVKSEELWALGPHRLLCGDARDDGHLERLMAGDRAHVLWTDPPYGVDYEGKTSEALRMPNDHRDDLEALLTEAFAAADRHLRAGARIYVAHPDGPADVVFGTCFMKAGWRWHQTLVWVKDSGVLGHTDYHYRHEPILYGYKPGPGRWGRGAKGWYGGNAKDSVLEVPRPKASREHPTSKPVELVARCLANSSRRGDLVLDSFAGSGTTLIACQEIGRRCRAVDIDPRYCEVIIARWEALTGHRAERIDG